MRFEKRNVFISNSDPMPLGFNHGLNGDVQINMTSGRIWFKSQNVWQDKGLISVDLASIIHSKTQKLAIAAGDEFVVADSEGGYVTKKITWENIVGALKLDDLGAPDDNTDLNATTDKHGLLRKLDGSTINFLRGDGTWATPPSGGSSDVGGAIHTASGKTTPVDADELGLVDSESSWSLKKLTWSNLKATLKTYLDTLYSAVGHNHSGTYAPATHASTHVTGGSDVIAAAVAGGASGLMTGADKTKLDGIAAGAEVNVNADWNAVSGDAQILNKPSSMTPAAHAASHKSGGSDAVKLDELAAPTDVTTLNASTSAHGLMPKLPNDATKFADGTGAWDTVGWSDVASKPASVTTAVIGITIDGGGSAITTGVKGDIVVPFAGTITAWDLVADQSGSLVIDVWKDTYANFPPTVAYTIAGSEKPTLSAASKNQDHTLTTWTTGVAAGDIIRFNVEGTPTSVTRATLVITITKT